MFSYWSRSINFAEVLNLYKLLTTSGIEASNITDISDWEPWESQIINRMGINQYNPIDGGKYQQADEAKLDAFADYLEL